MEEEEEGAVGWRGEEGTLVGARAGWSGRERTGEWDQNGMGCGWGYTRGLYRRFHNRLTAFQARSG